MFGASIEEGLEGKEDINAHLNHDVIRPSGEGRFPDSSERGDLVFDRGKGYIRNLENLRFTIWEERTGRTTVLLGSRKKDRADPRPVVEDDSWRARENIHPRKTSGR